MQPGVCVQASTVAVQLLHRQLAQASSPAHALQLAANRVPVALTSQRAAGAAGSAASPGTAPSFMEVAADRLDGPTGVLACGASCVCPGALPALGSVASGEPHDNGAASRRARISGAR